MQLPPRKSFFTTNFYREIVSYLPCHVLVLCSAYLLFLFLDMVKTINLGICTGFKPNDSEITVEGIDNSSSNLKIFIWSCNFRESNFNDFFYGG